LNDVKKRKPWNQTSAERERGIAYRV